MADRLLIERRADRVVATLNRPEVRNAIDQATIDALHALCAELEAEPRILIITGADGVFASGADIAELRERGAEEALAGINAHAFIRIHAAADAGHRRGRRLGARRRAPNSRTPPTSGSRRPPPGSAIPSRRSASSRRPAAAGGCPRSSAGARAAELLLTGRVIGADEALAAGLVTSIHPAEDLLAAAHAIADRIAANDPRATQVTKAVVRRTARRPSRRRARAQAELFESPEKRRRMTEFLERK